MIRVAIIGTGSIAHAHIQAYLQFPGRCRIVALCDIIPDKARKFGEKHGVTCDCYENHEELIRRDDIDLCDICTPPYVHASISVNCMRAGKNVVCEKPMAASLAECDEMIRVRDETGMLYAQIAQNRFRKPIRDLKALLDSGLAGPVKHGTVNSYWWRGHCYYDLWWRGTWEKEGGGCTLNHAVHHIDMLAWMMGLPKRVTSILANVSHDNAEIEDLSCSVLEYPGALVNLTASVVHHGEEQELVFQCADAKVAAPFSVHASKSLDNGFPADNPELEERIRAFCDALPDIPWEGHTGELENVLSAIENHTAPAITAEDGRNTLELITAIYKAGTEKRTVTLPIAKDDPFYTVEGIMASVPHFYEKTTSQMELGQSGITLGSDYKKK